MKADFNFGNKQTYGIHTLDNARKYKLMPEEVFNERNRMTNDGMVSRVLFFDLVRQTRLPAGMSSVDTANCYNRIAHAIASLVFQSFGVTKESAVSMLKAIEEMEFFLRTVYGDSKDYAGSTVEVRTQGLYQGNGGSPSGCTVIMITIIRAHKRKGMEQK